jgi:hypothetical protein
MRGPILALMLIALAAPAAHAKPADDALDTEVARRHFVKAKSYLAAHDYQAALKELLIARAVKPLPDFDFNIARCYELLERYPEAIDEYIKYVERMPDRPDAEEARDRVRILKERQQAIDAATAHAAKPAARASAPASGGTTAAPGKTTASGTAAGPASATGSASANATGGASANATSGASTNATGGAPATATATAPAGSTAAPAANTTATATTNGPGTTMGTAMVYTAPPRRTPVYKKWWFWTTIGAAVAVAAVAVGVGVALSDNSATFTPSLPAFGPNAPTR